MSPVPEFVVNLARVRREQMRWFLLTATNVSRPAGIYTEALLPILQAVYPDATHQEVKRELDYLEERDLVKIKRDPMLRWFVELTRFGVDMCEYVIDCEPGVARPTYGAG